MIELQNINDASMCRELDTIDNSTLATLAYRYKDMIYKLNLNNCVLVTDLGCSYLSFLTNITELFLGGCTISDNGILSISTLKLLSHLAVNETLISDNGLIQICNNFDKIIYLNLFDCVNISDYGMSSIWKLQNLCHLNISGCEGISDISLAFISRTMENSLSELLLAGNNITDKGLQFISKLSKLTLLNLSNCHKITDTGLDHIAKLPNLIDLDLYFCYRITNKGLNLISSLPKLEQLDIRMCPEITSLGLCLLSNRVNCKF